MERSLANSTALEWHTSEQRFVPIQLERLSWSTTDLGTTHGAILVERIRTFGGKLPDVDFHRDRFISGWNTLGIETTNPVADWPQWIDGMQQLLAANAEFIEQVEDVSIVLLVSPGDPHRCSPLQPTCKMHLAPIDFQRLARWYRGGAQLVTVDVHSVSSSSIPTSLKSRSRLHYYLADQQARAIDKHAVAILQTEQGNIADTSVASVLLVTHDDRLITPTHHDALMSTSIQMIESLLKDSSVRLEYSDVTLNDLRTAKELLLAGNTCCLCSISALDGQSIGDGTTSGPIAREIIRRWIAEVEFDWREQAIRLSF